MQNIIKVMLACGLLLVIVNVQAKQCYQPEKLIFSVIPSSKKKSELSLYKPLGNHISQQLNIPVEYRKMSSYKAVVNGIVSGKLHFARMGAFSYVTASNMSQFVQPFAAHQNAANPPFQDEGIFYRSALIVHADSAFHDVASLQNKQVLLTELGSTSGVLVPKVVFTKQMKIKRLTDFFGSMMHSKGQDNSIFAVRDKLFDAAFVSARRLGLMVAKGKVKENQFRVLWQSPNIPHDPYVYSTRLCEHYLAAIRNAFFSIHKTDEGVEMLKNLGARQLVPTSAQNYDIIRELSQKKYQ